ncbi:MAG TPA: radical SAM protein, partial [Candidatus Margulisiibacteriota bacterium]|nr:radical SAM protein [Candidatus Margulisiibacteriota bacterium]
PGRDAQFAMQEPLNIGFIASYLEKHGIEVKIIDELAGDEVARELDSFKPVIAGITATTPLADEAYRNASLCRGRGIKTVMGGVHASVMTEEALGHVDVVVSGEGEEAMLDIALNGAQGRLIRKQYIKNIDTIPRPAYHLMKMDFYLASKERVPYNTSLFFVPEGARVASLLTSRGCPHACTFCHNSWKDIPFRQNSAERVIEDLRYLISTYKIEALFFCDDNFFADRARLRNICFLMREEKINIPWSCNARADNVDLDTAQIVKEAGCRQLTFGFESGSQKILDILNKKSTVEEAREAVRICKKTGLFSVSTFIIGNPHERREDIELTRKFILESGLDCVGIGLTTPYPGTGIWKWCQENNFIPKEIKWSTFLADETPIQVSEYLSAYEVKRYRSKIYLEFALKQNSFFKLLKIAIFHPWKSLAKALRIFKHLS